LEEVKIAVEADIKEFKLSEALKKIYSLIWDDYCSWYLEWIKTAQDQPIVAENIEQAIAFFEELMKLLHPFMPFITEEIFANIKPREAGEIILASSLVASDSINTNVLQQGEALKSLITAIRDVKVKQGLKPKDEVVLYLAQANEGDLQMITDVLQKQSFASKISFTPTAIEGSISFMADKYQCYLTSDKAIDTSAQRESLTKELNYFQGFLVSVERKLSNEKFVANAKPEIIEIEVKKKNDALEKIRILEESLNLLAK
jgi:valyl-tRNA synthetase